MEEKQEPMMKIRLIIHGFLDVYPVGDTRKETLEKTKDYILKKGLVDPKDFEIIEVQVIQED